MKFPFKNDSEITTMPSQEVYRSSNRFQLMSTNELFRYFGIKLKWYQRAYLCLWDLKDKFDRKFRPIHSLWRDYGRFL